MTSERGLVLTASLLVLVPFEGCVRPPPSAPDVEIVGLDYAFVAPRELPAGQTTFRFTNKGKVLHEMHILLLRKDTTEREVMAATNENRPFAPLFENSVGMLNAFPGEHPSAGLSTDLLPGRDYIVICRNSDGNGPMHARMGMVAVIHVLPAHAARQHVTADTIVAMDYAFRAPAILAAGRHTLAFASVGRHVHEVNIALLKRGVTVDQAFKLAQKSDDPGLRASVEEWLGVLFAHPGDASLGSLEVTLLPGRDYMLKCDMTDTDSSPPHVRLGMLGSIHTPK